jgi:hypothetical protein
MEEAEKRFKAIPKQGELFWIKSTKKS